MFIQWGFVCIPLSNGSQSVQGLNQCVLHQHGQSSQHGNGNEISPLVVKMIEWIVV